MRQMSAGAVPMCHGMISQQQGVPPPALSHAYTQARGCGHVADPANKASPTEEGFRRRRGEGLSCGGGPSQISLSSSGEAPAAAARVQNRTPNGPPRGAGSARVGPHGTNSASLDAPPRRQGLQPLQQQLQTPQRGPGAAGNQSPQSNTPRSAAAGRGAANGSFAPTSPSNGNGHSPKKRHGNTGLERMRSSDTVVLASQGRRSPCSTRGGDTPPARSSGSPDDGDAPAGFRRRCGEGRSSGGGKSQISFGSGGSDGPNGCEGGACGRRRMPERCQSAGIPRSRGMGLEGSPSGRFGPGGRSESPGCGAGQQSLHYDGMGTPCNEEAIARHPCMQGGGACPQHNGHPPMLRQQQQQQLQTPTSHPPHLDVDQPSYEELYAENQRLHSELAQARSELAACRRWYEGMVRGGAGDGRHGAYPDPQRGAFR